MTLVALDGTPLVAVGMAHRNGVPTLATLSATLMDAANEASILIGQIFTEDGASHTIDTTGSSSLGWRSGAVTFANAGTTVKVGLATVDTATGPPNRATNVADVITFSVSKTHTGGGGGITATAWQENVPDAGTMTIANGDLVAFAIQMTARGNVDAINQTNEAASGPTAVRPSVTSFTGGAYADSARFPNAVITFSDGVRGYFYGGFVASVATTTQTWNNTGTNEFGNFLQLPVPAKIYGIIAGLNAGGDCDLNLYTTPLGTPVSAKSVSIDANTVTATSGYMTALFASPYSATANQPLAVIATPTSATNVSLPYKTFAIAGHQTSETLGANGYAVSRASGAFAVVNSNKDRFAIGLLVGAFDAGGSTGYPASRVQLGM